jgi:hypothetical protein
MRKLSLELEEDVIAQIRQEFNIKAACGNLWGAVDAFIYQVLKALDGNADRLYLKMPEKKGEG